MSELFKDMPRFFRREIAARRMIRMKVKGYYDQYCEQLQSRLKDPMADKQTLFNLKELCAVWHPSRVQEYFESHSHLWDCERNEVHGYGADEWWQGYLHWLDNPGELDDNNS